MGAEAALYPSVERITGEHLPIGGPTLAEGIAVKNVGKLTLPVIRELVAEIVLVNEAQLERAVNAYLTLQKTMAEGAGAAGLAALLAKPDRFRGKRVGLILCGGNIDPRILASIMVRELERETRIVSFRLTIPTGPACSLDATRLGVSAPIFWKSITAGCSSTCRPRAPSFRRHHRDARCRACRGHHDGARATAISRCASNPARWK